MDDASSPVPTPSDRSDPDALLTWSRPAQLAACVILALAIGFLLGKWSGDPPPGPATPPSARLDLNRATHGEMMLLPGLGETLARRIEEHRRTRGPFRSVEGLADVHGVGPATLDRLRPWLFVEAPAERVIVVPTMHYSATPPPAKGKKEAGLAEAIDVNRADSAELQKLPGIGPKLSQRILDERLLRGPFKSVEELRRVPGLGPKTLEKLRPYVRADSPVLSSGASHASAVQTP